MSKFDQMSKEEQERLLHYARRAKVKSLPWVAYKDGTFKLNGKSILHSQWIALVDQATMGWYRYTADNKKLLEKHTVNIFNTDLPPRPNTFTDRSKWAKNDYGTLKDPWGIGWELPLQQPETGELAVFNSNAEWAKQAIGDVIEYFAQSRRRPIIQLEVRETIKDAKTIKVGALDIVGPDESDDFVVDLARSVVVDDPAAPKSNGGSDPVAKFDEDEASKKHDDMDDDIPL